MDVLDRADHPFPHSLPEFQRLFPDDAACAAYLEKARWGDGSPLRRAGSRKSSSTDKSGQRNGLGFGRDQRRGQQNAQRRGESWRRRWVFAKISPGVSATTNRFWQLAPPIMIAWHVGSHFPFPRQEGARERCPTKHQSGIGERSRRPEGAGNATLWAAFASPRSLSRGACDATLVFCGASRRTTLLAGNFRTPSYVSRNHDRGH